MKTIEVFVGWARINSPGWTDGDLWTPKLIFADDLDCAVRQFKAMLTTRAVRGIEPPLVLDSVHPFDPKHHAAIEDAWWHP